MRSVQYIVVGQGLAGSCVALQLLRQQKSFVVISTPEHSRSSIVAAGLFNPVTGQNLVKTWMCDIVFPYLQKFYREAESLTGEDFFHNVPLYRPFVSAEEQNTWMARTVDPEYSGLIDRVSDGSFNRGISDPMGGLWVKNSGYIETAAFLSAVRELLKKKGLYIEELFDYSRLEVRNDVLYGDLTSARVIFCEGYRLSENPWFKKVPLRPLKGETIDIKSGFSEHVILNCGVYMVPRKKPGLMAGWVDLQFHGQNNSGDACGTFGNGAKTETTC